METIISLARMLRDQGCNENDINVLVDIASNQLAAKRGLTVRSTIEFVNADQLDVTIELFDGSYLYHEFSIIVRR